MWVIYFALVYDLPIRTYIGKVCRNSKRKTSPNENGMHSSHVCLIKDMECGSIFLFMSCSKLCKFSSIFRVHSLGCEENIYCSFSATGIYNYVNN